MRTAFVVWISVAVVISGVTIAVSAWTGRVANRRDRSEDAPTMPASDVRCLKSSDVAGAPNAFRTTRGAGSKLTPLPVAPNSAVDDL